MTYASEKNTADLVAMLDLPEPLRLAALLKKTSQGPLHGKAADCLERLHAELELQRALVAEAQAMTAKVCAENEELKAQESELYALYYGLVNRANAELRKENESLRAVLAKWGAPQQAAHGLDSDLRTDAMCQLAYCNGMKAGWNFCEADNEAGFARAMDGVSEAMRVLKTLRKDAAPQQAAPAEREPLSETELNRFFDMLKANPQTEWWTDLQWFQSGCVAAEAAHGIKGG